MLIKILLADCSTVFSARQDPHCLPHTGAHEPGSCYVVVEYLCCELVLVFGGFCRSCGRMLKGRTGFLLPDSTSKDNFGK